ncbi:MAG: DNA ligase (NAD(+)) LigA, partial [Phaeodactylibacter sp.]|nr:DNA ligase (NAD(+)) LigA [Phaeodactylibacter sp.]
MYSTEEQRALFELSKAYLEPESPLKRQSPDQQLAALRRILVYHEYRYYILNDPVVSDYEYDQLYKQLEALEMAHPEMVTPDSPTQRVSADLVSDFPSVEHLTPMLSLANSYNAEDLAEFDAQIKRYLNLPAEMDIEYSVEPKFDGGSIAAVYENGQLVRAATRGNGMMGEEMTHNARAIRSIPLKADFARFGIHKVELRGEVLIRKDIFEKINKKRAEEGLTLFANARNTATGGLRMKDPQEVAKRGLEAFIYTLGYAIDKDGNDILSRFSTHSESLDMLAQLGFKVPILGQERDIFKNIGEAVGFCLAWQDKREAYPYEIDGMVVKANSRELQERSGSTSHHPRWAIAFKFK